jgi:hypothetical protein
LSSSGRALRAPCSLFVSEYGANKVRYAV